MKTLLLLCTIFISINVYAQPLIDDHFDLDQFPIWDHKYQPGKDIGYSKYSTKSLRKSRKVVLTFDDGPDKVLTPRLLDILKKHNVKATFFVLTQNIKKDNIHIIRRIMNEGHTLASHHQNHVNNNSKARAIYKAELTQSIKQLANLLDSENAERKEIYYRFPYGNYGSSSRDYHHMNVIKEVSQQLFGDNCINFAFWDIDTSDWVKGMQPADIVSTVLAHIDGGRAYTFEKVKNAYVKKSYTIKNPIGGGVILMHDVQKVAVDTADLLIRTLKEKNIEIVDLQDVEEYSFHGKECRLL